MKTMKKGFTLIEVLVASVILTLGIVAVLGLFLQSYKLMTSSFRFETAQRVLNYFEMVHPIPVVDQVSGDPLDDELLNVPEEKAEDLAEELEIELSRSDREDIAGYTVERTVDEIEDEELERLGGIYTVRTTVKWGGDNFGGEKESMTVVKLWWKEQADSSSRNSNSGSRKK